MCRVQGSGCRVQGPGFRVLGAGCRVQGAGLRVPRVLLDDHGGRGERQPREEAHLHSSAVSATKNDGQTTTKPVKWPRNRSNDQETGQTTKKPAIDQETGPRTKKSVKRPRNRSNDPETCQNEGRERKSYSERDPGGGALAPFPGICAHGVNVNKYTIGILTRTPVGGREKGSERERECVFERERNRETVRVRQSV